MSFFVHAIRDVVRPDFVCDRLRLEETAAGSSLPPVELQAAGQTALLLNLDRALVRKCGQGHDVQIPPKVRLFPMLDTERPGIGQCCDYVIFSQRTPGDDLTVLLCELKSSHATGAFAQIQNAAMLVESMLQMVAWHNRQIRRPQRTVWRGIVFKTGRPPKSGFLKPCPYQTQSAPIGDIGLVHLGACPYRLDWLCAPV